MIEQYRKYRGIHPGLVIERELKKRAIRQRPFALSLDEHPQSFNAITKGRRGISTSLALKIERELGLDEGTLVLLQAYYDIEKAKEKEMLEEPNFSILNRALFWDTDLSQINWKRKYKAVIQRVFERGNESDQKEITRFYGAAKVNEVLKKLPVRSPYVLRAAAKK